LPGRKVQDVIYAARGAEVHRYLTLGSRKMSMTAIHDGTGDVVIRIVDKCGKKDGVADRDIV
jgi:hypothetical protein